MLAAYILFVISLGTSAWYAYKLSLSRKHRAPTVIDAFNGELPTVSVCIPARNEAHALSDCLERVLLSDYPKLEILVLDDNSDDDTSVLIKSFAHAGVRFIAGKPLPKNWLGKNYALDTLAREASGDMVLFMDVDTRIDSFSISRLVAYKQNRHLTMLSVVPQRRDTARMSAMFGYLRYFWELTLSRPDRPATSCAFWLIDRNYFLETLGGFTKVLGLVQPEEEISAFLSEKKQADYLISRPSVSVNFEKHWKSQIETAQRLLAPKMVSGPREASMGKLGILGWNTWAILMVYSFFETQGWILTFISLLAGILVYRYYLSFVWTTRYTLGALLWPYIALQDLVLLTTSIVVYRIRRVMWKGRLVQAQNLNVQYLQLDE